MKLDIFDDNYIFLNILIYIKLFESGLLRNFHWIRIEAPLKYFCFISRAIRRSSFTIVCQFFLSSLQPEVLKRYDEWSFRGSHASVHTETGLFFVYTLDSLFTTCLFVKQLFPSSACFKIRMDPSWVNVNKIHCNDAVKFLFRFHRNSSRSSHLSRFYLN